MYVIGRNVENVTYPFTPPPTHTHTHTHTHITTTIAIP